MDEAERTGADEAGIPGTGNAGESGIDQDGPPGMEARQVRIAVAHQLDDQAETILHNLCRGSGLKGLGGMRPVRGRVIRPLIAVTREEIMEWLASRKLSFCEDSTNQTDFYTLSLIHI